MPNPENREITPLTGLRAIAAYMVFFHHFPLGAELIGSTGFTMQWQSHVGVSVFFVLSGFLISYNYSDNLKLEIGWYVRYLRNRVARIYPVYLAATIVAMIYLSEHDLRTWIMNLTLFRGFFREFYFYHIGQAWSLTVEMVFYIFAPFLLVLVGRIPLGLLCLVFYGLGFALTQIELPWGTFMDPPRMVVANTFFGRCFEFLLGIWLHKRFRGVESSGSTWATYAGAFLLVGFLYASTFATELTVYSPTFSPAHHYIFPCIVGLLIYGLWKEDTVISLFLGNAFMLVLGRASYAFYLLHADPFKDLLGMSDAPILLHFLVINLLSVGVYFIFEKPLHRVLKSKSVESF